MDAHPDSLLLDKIGTTTEVARLMAVRPQAVSGWRRYGVPRARRQTLELLRPDVFVLPMQCEEARDAA